ncbi:formyl-CoA transferase [Pollutimonas nitritireducens]|uniref:Formyl-CoA transferase n=1 Tax=Pollutimonas nitritireducens TaxID=2045209 RepID=A0A2N4UGC2_9BURK|nr:CaiB/BaiF CoA-transferase family protein [Pollutimonas nitritireducens]PLC54072.1 formyl-CoA transferase [Pollutimonas nitritireducens]
MKPLKGMKVVDLTKVLAGPLCSQYLGEFGADVIKIETPGTGDDTRGWLPQDHGQSAVFLAVNHNKRSLAVDLKTEAGLAAVHRLVQNSDIVMQGFGGGTAKKLGVDYETLAALNPKLIYCEISGYGRTGPMGNEPGYDVMLQAFSGMISTIGEKEGHYARASFSPVDIGTAMHGLSGVLAAVIERGRTGKGVYLEISLLDTALGFMSYMAQSYWRTGVNPKPMGTAHPSMSPYQAFQASDGPIMLGAGNDAQWRRFCSVAGLDSYVDHPDFATNAIRMSNLAKTEALVQDVMKTRTVSEWLSCLSAVGVPCSPIYKLGEALSHPQVASRGLIVASNHPVLGELQNIGHPVRFQQKDRTASRPPPLHGEHSEEILLEAGYSREDIQSFKEHGIITQACAA